jgi:hypothetical protein
VENLKYLKILFTLKGRTQSEDFKKYDVEKRKKKDRGILHNEESCDLWS